MLVKQKQLKKKDVTVVKETDSISAALDQLNISGYRCIPVVDETGEKFVGNIYKVEILEYKLKDGDMQAPVKQLTEEADAFVTETSSFFEVFKSLKQLPYLAVVDEKGTFTGILPHSNVIELIEEAWGYRTGSCALTITLTDSDGMLVRVLTAIKKIWEIHSVFSLDDNTTYLRRVIVSLKKGANQSTIKEIEQAIIKKGARIIDIEVFDKENY